MVRFGELGNGNVEGMGRWEFGRMLRGMGL